MDTTLITDQENGNGGDEKDLWFLENTNSKQRKKFKEEIKKCEGRVNYEEVIMK